jgi:hypothetical protein
MPGEHGAYAILVVHVVQLGDELDEASLGLVAEQVLEFAAGRGQPRAHELDDRAAQALFASLLASLRVVPAGEICSGYSGAFLAPAARSAA